MVKTLKAIKAKAKENAEERGLETLFVGLGMLSWRADDGGRDPLAPLFLLAVTIPDNPARRGDLGIKRAENAELILNPVLFEALPPELADLLRSFVDEDTLDDLGDSVEAVKGILNGRRNVDFHARCVLANFSFQLMAMVEDLKRADSAMAGSILVKAIAGDSDAQTELTGGRDGYVEVLELDDIPARDEAFVLDADPWQAQVLHTLLRFDSANAVIDGPPGTGKSQTIANAIASFVAAGKTVLFVAEKRAALDVVHKRLSDVGLGTLVLDLHGADVTRKKVYSRLGTAVQTLKRAIPASEAEVHHAFEQARQELNDHAAFINGPLPKPALSPIQIMGRLSKLPESAVVDLRWAGTDLDALDRDASRRIRGLLAEAASHPDLFLRSPGAPWAVADFKSDDEPGIAIAAISELLRDIPYLKSALAAAAPAASLHTSADLEAACGHVTILREIIGVFQPSLLGLDEATLEAASSALSSPFCWLLVLLSSSKKSAITAVQACVRGPTNRPAICRALQAWRNLPAEWRTALRSLPDSSAPRLYDAIARFPKAWRDLHRVYPVGLPADLDDCIFTLQSMDREKLAAHRVRRLRDVERELRDLRLATFIELIGDQRLAPAHWEPAFDRSWLLSHLDRVMPTLATFNGRLHDKIVERFCEADQMRIELARHRILRAVAERHIETTRAFPKQQSALDLQIQKQRGNKPIRDMFAEAPRALAGICPCVMASPLSVSQFLPCEPLFDVVIFDEASQVAPETAITAILRGRRLVVAGDEHQLPPTSFFTAISEEDDDADEDSPIVGMESILDTVKPFFKPLGLRVHYRSQDERLIAFSNHHIYDDRLVTFAGSGKDGAAVSHVLVPPRKRKGMRRARSPRCKKSSISSSNMRNGGRPRVLA